MQRFSHFFKLTRRTFAIAITLLTAVAVAQNPANDVCTSIVQAALQAANTSCSGTARNQVCYGNAQGAATPADGVTDLAFENVGDITGVTRIKALQLSALDEETNEWGVALMQLQANLPDTLPGQNVTFLLFGDTTIEANTGDQARIDGTTNQPANLRLGPNATGPVLGSLANGTSVVATGKATNSLGETWVRVRYEEYRTRTGWMLAELLDVDMAALPDVATDSLTMNPMQAFYFRTGIGQTKCASAPVDGVVVQTPEGAGRVNFSVNGIDVAIGSTVFLTSPEDGGIDLTCIALLNGDADLQSAGAGTDLNPGERSCTPLNEDGTSGKPGPAEPFDPAEVASIAQVLDSLPQDVEIPDPAPIRTPTPTLVPPTATPVPEQPTDVPTQNNNPDPQPTTAPEPEERSINVDRKRHGTTVDMTAHGGPDAPESYTWRDGESTRTGQSVTFGFFNGYSYSVDLTVCWSDGECINRSVNGTIPECAIDRDQPTTISLTFDGGTEEYKVFKSDEDCVFSEVGDFGATHPNFSSGVFYGEEWHVKQLPGLELVRTYNIYTEPVVDTIPGGVSR